MSAIITVENLGKKYIIRRQKKERYLTLRDTIMRNLRRVSQFVLHPVSSNRKEIDVEEFWALKDVFLKIKQGDRVGIIGRNGAGKSTLLKIFSRITHPNTGFIRIKGRVASLLEVGTGFHPELTGRENIYLNGAILGMTRREIVQKFDEIVDFSGVEKFIDTPVKRYSSGMKVRLAFSVAAHLETEIMLVDEVLAVGDADFQEKCLGKMNAVAQEGRTVLFVSHNMGAIQSLTENCIYLEAGKVVQYDKTAKVVERYIQDILKQKKRPTDNLDSYRFDPFVKSSVRFTRIWVNDSTEELPIVEMGSKFSIFFEVQVNKEIQGANLALNIKNMQGHLVVTFFSWDQKFLVSLSPGKHIIELEVDGLPLIPGQYLVNVGVNQSTVSRAFDSITDFPLMQVVNNGQVVHWLERPWGSVHWEQTKWRLVT